MRNFFKICIVLLALSGKMYSQNWLWVKSLGVSTSTINTTSNVRLGSSGNLITFLVEPTNSRLIFTNADGDVLWNKYYQNLVIKDVCIDGADNIYFAGVFTGTTNIGSNTFVSQGSVDAIIGMFNNSGVLIKSKAFGTYQSEYANSLTLHNNEIIVTGSFIVPQMVGVVSLTGNGTTFNTFVLKFDSNFIAQSGIETASSGCAGIKVAVDQTNSIYLIGTSVYTLSIGTQTTYVALDGYYFAKLNNNLTPIWLQTISEHFSNGTYRPYIYFDISGNVVLSHQTGGGGGSDWHLRIEKYTSGGSYIWGKDVKITEPSFTSVDSQDNIWVAGRYSTYGADMFSIFKINSAGTTVTTLFYDTNIKHGINGLAVKANNEFYIVGNCDGTSTLNGYGCSPNGSVFMAHYGSTAANIEKLTLNNSISIYPNPATGMITISCISGIKSGCTLIIKNALGQLVYLDPLKETSGSFIREVDLGFTPRGAYFVEVESNYERTSKTVILH